MSNILDLPFFYNLRVIVAGNQQLTKDFIISNYHHYACHSVLDMGCGTGDFSILFNKYEYKGVDVSKKYINFAQKRYSSHTFLNFDIVKCTVDEKIYDATLFISVLHHLSDKDVESILSTVCKITKKVIIIVDLNPDTSLLKKILIKLDRGDFVRTTQQKKNLLTKFGKLVKITHFSTGLASQTGMILIPKRNL